MSLNKFLAGLAITGLLCTGCVTVTADGRPIKENGNTTTGKTSQELSQMLNTAKGEYLELDTQKTNRLVQEVTEGNLDTIKKVMDNPNDYEPPVLFAYAEQVYKSGHFDTAMFWFYTAQIRARSDANKSLDNTVQDGVTRLSSVYGQTIGRYALEHPNELESTMNKVLEWDRISQRNYNPKWVAVLGNESKISDTIRFQDPEKYKAIDEEVRRGWKIGFDAALKKIRESKLEVPEE